MMLKTHLAIGVFFIIVLLPHVSSPVIFIAVTIAATLLPDIDSAFSIVGSMKGFKPVQAFSKHRGFFHSFTFCILFSILLALFFPILCLGFFLGYSIHLFADSFTKDGIQPFWPSKETSSWHFRTGGITETSIFVFFLIFDLILFIVYVASI